MRGDHKNLIRSPCRPVTHFLSRIQRFMYVRNTVSLCAFLSDLPECPNYIKSHVTLHVKSYAQKVN